MEGAERDEIDHIVKKGDHDRYLISGGDQESQSIAGDDQDSEGRSRWEKATIVFTFLKQN